MVDVDGVLIIHPDAGGWSGSLERDLGLSSAVLHEAFFKPHWDDLVHGRATLRDRLALVLPAIAPHLSSEELIDYWFGHDAHVDVPLLHELMGLRAAGIEVHLATVQEHERASYLWDRLDFRSKFDGMHYAAALGHSKPAVGFYRSIEARTGLTPEAIFYIDDRQENVAGAKACGWTAAVWTGDDTLKALIDRQDWCGA